MQFTYCRERYWLVGVTRLLLKISLRGHKSEWHAVMSRKSAIHLVLDILAALTFNGQNQRGLS